jgi:hypothetical protein
MPVLAWYRLCIYFNKQVKEKSGMKQEQLKGILANTGLSVLDETAPARMGILNDLELREGMISEMRCLAQSTLRLLALLESEQIIDDMNERSQTQYQEIMQNIAASALRSQRLVVQSQAVDQNSWLVSMPVQSNYLN